MQGIVGQRCTVNIRHQDKELQGDKMRKLNIKMRRGGQDENIRNQDEELEEDKMKI